MVKASVRRNRIKDFNVKGQDRHDVHNIDFLTKESCKATRYENPKDQFDGENRVDEYFRCNPKQTSVSEEFRYLTFQAIANRRHLMNVLSHGEEIRQTI